MIGKAQVILIQSLKINESKNKENNLKNMDNKGTFKSALTQSFKGIKETKAAAITEDVELSYRRKIEDLCRSAR